MLGYYTSTLSQYFDVSSSSLLITCMGFIFSSCGVYRNFLSLSFGTISLCCTIWIHCRRREQLLESRYVSKVRIENKSMCGLYGLFVDSSGSLHMYPHTLLTLCFYCLAFYSSWPCVTWHQKAIALLFSCIMGALILLGHISWWTKVNDWNSKLLVFHLIIIGNK
jgi:hypothetical protein